MNNAAPRVSVILPAYNRARTLPRALHSVLAQDDGQLEVIVADDASTDDTPQLMARLADPRVRYLRLPVNGGPAAARNAALDVARGEYIAFQDSDDEWLPLKLEKQLAALMQAGPAVDLVICGQLRWDRRTLSYLPQHGRLDARQGRLREDILRNNFALTPSWLVRRKAFDALGGFDASLPMLEDWEWLIRYNARYRAVLLDEPLMMVWESSDSISNQHAKYVRALGLIIARHADALAGDRRSLAGLHYVLAKKEAMHGTARAARRAFLSAVRIWPYDARHWAGLALSLLGSSSLFNRAWRLVRRLKGFDVPPTSTA